MNKKALTTIIVLGVIISIGYFATPAKANNFNSGRDTLITRISQRFNLNKSDVEAVFDAIHDEHQSEMNAKREERLSQAVTDGVITQTQKDALIAKMQENHDNRIQYREDMDKWFTDQGIDKSKLKNYLGVGVRRNGMGMMKFIK